MMSAWVNNESIQVDTAIPLTCAICLIDLSHSEAIFYLDMIQNETRFHDFILVADWLIM